MIKLGALLGFVNYLVANVGFQIVRSESASGTMQRGLERVKTHVSLVNSVIDIGASDGRWTRVCMKSLPESKYLCVEPLVERRASLERLTEKFGPRVSYSSCVAGDSNNSKVEINVSTDLDGSTVDGKGGAPRWVSSRTIDSLVLEHKLAGPYMLKFDTHGFECQILEGCKETLNATEIIIMECYNFQITENALRFPQMCAHLEGLGFRCVDIVDVLLRPGDKALWQFDLFFVRSDSKVFSKESYI